LRVCAPENFAKDVRKIKSLFGDDIKTPEIKEPNESNPKAGNKELTKTQKKIHYAKIPAFVKEEKSMEDSLTAMYNITWGQCSAIMQNRLESVTKYERINADADIAELSKEIRNISNEFQVSANIYDALDEVQRNYFSYFQQYNESNIKHV